MAEPGESLPQPKSGGVIEAPRPAEPQAPKPKVETPPPSPKYDLPDTTD